jgi:hypothetical protein
MHLATRLDGVSLCVQACPTTVIAAGEAARRLGRTYYQI